MSPVFHSDCKKCNSIWWLLIASLYLCIYLFGSLRASSLGGGGREGERGSTPKRACSQAIYLGELAMLEVISVCCRLHAPHSQIWPEYELETASCSHWNQGEPNNYGGNEGCGHMFPPSEKWNYAPCHSSLHSLCETNGEETLEIATKRKK